MQQRRHINPQRSGSSCRRLVGSFAVLGGLVIASCSSGGGGDIGTLPPEVDGVVETIDAGPDFVPSEENSDDVDATSDTESVPTTEFDLAAQPSTPPIDPVSETGVPGIDSSDAFCRAWSEFAGSFQALGLTSAIGDPANAFQLEVIAASSVTSAVEALDADLPAELESERVALIADFAGPFFSRALLAEIELEAAGIEPDSLREIWLATLSEAGVDDPFISIDVTSDIDAAALAAAVASFSSAQPAIVDDPTLITSASIPATETYLADVCPDGGILSGNDDIGG